VTVASVPLWVESPIQRKLSNAHLGRVFDPFFKTRLGRGGSGLGLNIAAPDDRIGHPRVLHEWLETGLRWVVGKLPLVSTLLKISMYWKVKLVFLTLFASLSTTLAMASRLDAAAVNR
jgi:hypothetical protein